MYSLHVYYMCITCVLHVSYMCVTCVLHVYYMCLTCVLHMCYMCVTCVLHVSYMCVTCKHMLDYMKFFYIIRGLMIFTIDISNNVYYLLILYYVIHCNKLLNSVNFNLYNTSSCFVYFPSNIYNFIFYCDSHILFIYKLSIYLSKVINNESI